MIKPLRFLFVALLALVVPLQGAAAVSAGQCMALGHHDTESHAIYEPEQDAAGAHSHPVPSSSEEGSVFGAHCGPCVACCASAATAAPFMQFPFAPLGGVAYGAAKVVPPGVLPSGFDRPPLRFS